MEVHQQNEVWKELEDGDLEFAWTKIVIRGQNDQYFYATTKVRIHLLPPLSPADLDRLDKTPISIDNIWPLFSTQFSRAPEPLPSGFFVKGPCLINCDETEELAYQPSSFILREVQICEFLKKHPHPNIATYIGCVVDANRIKGLCLVRYKMTLEERLKVAAPFDKDLCLRGIEQGIQHLHSLGLVHNDINPHNVMVDEMDHAVIIDFDSCQHEGRKLVKGGTIGWSMEEMEKMGYSRFENDAFGLSKIRELLLTSSNDVGP